MKLKDKKGSISIFVLVMLLFMTGFLLILYANNVNKSKVVKEQFNIISDIYAYGGGEESAYDKAYTDLRKKNRQTLKYDSLESGLTSVSEVELTKTFEDKISNYRIYGSAEGVGDKTINLFNPNQEFVSIGAYTGIDITGTNTDYTLQVKLKEGKTIPAGLYLGYAYWSTESSSAKAYWLISNGAFNERYVHETNGTSVFFNANGMYKAGIAFYGLTEENRDIVMDAFDILWVEGIYDYSYIPDYEEYGKYKLPIEVTGRNLVNIPKTNLEFTDYYYVSYFPSNPKVLLEANTTYTLSFDYVINSSTTNNIYCAIGYGTNVFSKNIENTPIYGNQTEGRCTLTFKTPSEFESGIIPYLQIRFAHTDIIASVNIDISNVQFKYGNNDTGYMQFFNGQSEKIILQLPLYEGDYIDFKQGKVVRADGTEEYIDLPELLTYEDYTKIEVLTEVATSRIEVEYQGYTLEGN